MPWNDKASFIQGLIQTRAYLINTCSTFMDMSPEPEQPRGLHGLCPGKGCNIENECKCGMTYFVICDKGYPPKLFSRYGYGLCAAWDLMIYTILRKWISSCARTRCPYVGVKAGVLGVAHSLGLDPPDGHNVHLHFSDGMAATSCTMERRTLRQSSADVPTCCSCRLHRQAQVPGVDCHQDLGGRSSTKSQ